MIKNIVDGGKEVVSEILTGLNESFHILFIDVIKNIYNGTKEVILDVTGGIGDELAIIKEFFDEVNVKLLGSYEEIEAFEKAKAGKKSA